MADRDSALRGLAEISEYMKARADIADIVGVGKEKEIFDSWYRATEDALALLREQEPRVMTLEEVKAFDWDYCYLEEERLDGKEYRAVCGDYALTCITWPCVTSMRIQHGDEKYGKKWRCWTHKPTDEQREAVKWDADAAD